MHLISSCDSPSPAESSSVRRQIDLLDSAVDSLAALDPDDQSIVERELDRLFIDATHLELLAYHSRRQPPAEQGEVEHS